MKKIIGVAVIGAVVFSLALGILRSRESEEVLSISDIQKRDGIPVFAETVQRHDVAIRRSFYGTVLAADQSAVSARLMERITRIRVREGDPVTADQVLVQFDTTASLAMVNQAKLQVLNARRDLDRMNELLKKGAVSDQQFDQVTLGYSVAEENYRTALNSVQLLAPISGIVGRINFNEGDIAFPGDVILTVVNDKRYEVKFDLTQEDRPRLHSGQPVSVTLDAGKTIEGKITRISLAADDETRLFQAWAAVPAADPVYPGMLVSVDVVVEKADNALAVPAPAILERDGRNFVFVIRDGTTAIQQTVQQGIQGEKYVEILQGLSQGDLVATYGHTSLEDSAKVKVVKESDSAEF